MLDGSLSGEEEVPNQAISVGKLRVQMNAQILTVFHWKWKQCIHHERCADSTVRRQHPKSLLVGGICDDNLELKRRHNHCI